MWKRLLVATMLLAGLLGTPASAGPPAAPRIVAVGDLHGDYDAWRAIARTAGLIDASGRWAGGTTIFVQTGDVVDRGDDSLKIIRDLQRLQVEAPRQGGKVVPLIGNHEAMNMTGDLRYVTVGEFRAFADARSEARREQVYQANRDKIEAAYRAVRPDLSRKAIHGDWIAKNPLGKVEHALAWRPDGEIGRWIMANDAVALIDGNLFAHGGISARFAALPVTEINRQVRSALAVQDSARTAIINDPEGPLWYRGLLNRSLQGGDGPPPPPAAVPVPTIEQELSTVLAAYRAKRIIVGHTPILEGISVRYGGRLIGIDTGDSRHYGGVLSYLEIIGDNVVPHQVPRPNGK